MKTNANRSYIMSRIRSKDTKPELMVRKYLHAVGFRFRLHVKELPGKPDIVLPKYQVVIFVHGCFWHGHEKCGVGHIPKSNTNYWEGKIGKNIARDKKHLKMLRILGWKTVTIWECELSKNKSEITLQRIVNSLRKISMSSK